MRQEEDTGNCHAMAQNLGTELGHENPVPWRSVLDREVGQSVIKVHAL